MATKQHHYPRFRVLATVVVTAVMLVTGCSNDKDVAVEDAPDPQDVINIGVAMASPGLVSGVDPTQATGLEVDLAVALTDRMNTTPPNAELRWIPTTSGTLAQEDHSGALDLAIGQFIGPELSAELSWVGPYATVEAGLLVHRSLQDDAAEPNAVLLPTAVASLQDLSDASVCVVAGSLVATADLPVEDTVQEPTVTECEIGMRSGRYDAIAADDLQLAGLLQDPTMTERYQLLLWSDLAADDGAVEINLDEKLLATSQYWISVSSAYCPDAAAALETVVTEGVLEQLFASWEAIDGYQPQLVEAADLTTQHCDTAD